MTFLSAPTAGFAGRVSVARRNKGLSQADVARELAVSATTVNDWEHGKSRRIDGVNLLNLSQLLGVSPWWILFGFSEAQRPADADLASPVQPSDLLDLMTLWRALASDQRGALLTLLRSW